MINGSDNIRNTLFDGMFDSGILLHLLGYICECDMQSEAIFHLYTWPVQAIGLSDAAFEQVTLHGPLVEPLADRYHHLHVRHRAISGICNPIDRTYGVGEHRLATLKQILYIFLVAETLGFAKGVSILHLAIV